MVSFADAWTNIVATLKMHAEYLGVDSENIMKGNFAEGIPIRPPGIIVYMLPGNSLLTADPPQITPATVNVFCVTSPENDLPLALGLSIDMAEKVKRVIMTMKVYQRIPRQPITPDTVKADICVTNFAYVTAYDAPARPA